MKVLMLLGLVGAAIYGALVLSSDFFPHDPAENAFAGRSLGNPSDRRLRSWGTDLSSLASSSSQEASLPLPKPAVTAASTSPSTGSEGKPTTARPGLVLADRSTATQTAMATPARKVAGEAAKANPAPTAKKPVRASRPAARMPDKFAVALDRRWERRATRRGGLFFFGRRFARAE
jgi:hypothetical protein